MVQFIFGRAGSGKTTVLFERLQTALQSEHPLLLLVPEQFSFESERTLVKRFGMADAARVQVYSFSRLADRILKETGGIADTVMDDLTRTLMMSRALEIQNAAEHLTEDTRPRYHDAAYLSALLAFSDECKQCDVSPRQLELTAKALEAGSLQQKMLSFSALFDSYNALCSGVGIDQTDLLQIAAEKLADCDLWTGAEIFIDGFKGFTALQLKLISLLMQRADITVTLCIPRADTAATMGLFAPTARSLRELLALCDRNDADIAEHILLTENKRAIHPALAALEAGAFTAKPSVYRDTADTITVTPCPDIHAECAAVARTIRRTLRQTDMRARDIAVIARNFGDYVGVLDNALRRADVPFFMDIPADVTVAPLSVLATCALRIAADGYHSENIFRLLKTAILPFDETEIARLENYVYLWRVDGKSWEKPFTANPAGITEERYFDYQTLEQVEATRRAIITPLAALRKTLAAKTDGKTFASAMYTLLTALGADRGTRALYADLTADGEVALAEFNARLWDAMMQILDRFAAVFCEDTLSAKRYLELFTLAVSLIRLPAVPQSVDAVQVGSADHVRLSSPRAVFIVGANEGVFPAYPVSGDLISDHERQLLEQIGLPLSGGRLEKAAEERFFAYLTLSAPREQLFVSYLTRIDGETALPSAIVTAIETVTPQYTRGVAIKTDGSDIESAGEGFDRLALAVGAQNTLMHTLQSALADHENFTDFHRAVQETLSPTPFAISPDTAAALFHTDMHLSASQTEMFYKCRFRYFCQYGMRLATRYVAEIDMSLFGTLTHYVMETLLPKYTDKNTPTPAVPDLQQQVHTVLWDYVQTKLGGVENRPAKFRYMLSLIERTAFSMLWFAVTEMAGSEFVPTDFELQIGKDGIESPAFSLDDGRGSVHIIGKVDRVDIYHRDGTAFVRVVDYKTGKKEFKLSEIPYGINMQMLLYLFAICQTAGKRYHADTLAPAGILYLSAKDITLKNTHAALETDRLKLLRQNGLLLRDNDVLQAMEKDGAGNFIPAEIKDNEIAKKSSVASREEFGIIHDLIEKLLKNMAATLLDGDIAAIPTGEEKYLPCTYCDFRPICKREDDDPARIMLSQNTAATLAAIREELEGDE